MIFFSIFQEKKYQVAYNQNVLISTHWFFFLKNAPHIKSRTFRVPTEKKAPQPK